MRALVLLKLAALSTAALSTPAPPAHARAWDWEHVDVEYSTSRLSQARRNLGATVAGGLAFFAGGCLTTGNTTMTQFICDNASTAIDVFGAGGRLIHTLRLSEARGWVSTCAVGSLVVMAGGGTSGVRPHSRVADIVDASDPDLRVRTHAAALTNGRWGVACAATAGRAYYLGGKVTVSGYGDSWTSPLIDVYDAAADTWARAGYNLTEDKESAVAVATSDGHVVVAGGWRYPTHQGTGGGGGGGGGDRKTRHGPSGGGGGGGGGDRKANASPAAPPPWTPPHGSAVVETLMAAAESDPQRVVGAMQTPGYDVGLVAGPNGTAYIVGNEVLHRVLVDGTVEQVGNQDPMRLVFRRKGGQGASIRFTAHT